MGDSSKDGVILLARILLMILFIIFGWMKLTNFGATVTSMEGYGAPMPYLAAIIAVVVEFLFGIALIVGIFTRPIALLFALYVLGTAFIGHPFWHMTGAEMMGNEINFFKNVSIIGGLLLLAVTGAGRYSLDHKLFDK
ncbi:DoxX family protein [Serratia sp. JUb9]|uniref:DoxX family protein n=1 Tax=Serratia rhizosphaerae TaxID=2597702 RepID=A0ABX6GPY6_9GAMM|nr:MULTISPECIES: DoxX family protein [Serratia]MCA4825325.1 DoxX family protein [Serratia rubidaea]MEB6338053.1 DoxX family protein [Serratia rhizosphaerae]QHA88351.1 DoxX family protein [Serratia rhizosphaerae]QNK33577.1 DoxX family protein [Serratia sp. JUb9]QPT12475.1 DoxX family protein [Serratia rubidaea]